MAKNSVAIVGRSRLAEELCRLSREKGFEATLSADVEKAAASSALAIDTYVADEEEKKAVLKKLDALLPPGAVLLSSCLAAPVTRLASWTNRPDRTVGFATFYPLEGKKVIELAGGLKTEDGAVREAERFFEALGKEAARVKDGAGLIFPRILSLIINEAARSLDEEVAAAEEIDLAMRLGVNYPMGPLRWADQIGLDEVLAVLEGLQRETGEDRYRPAPLLNKMVLAGWLGEQSGRGFYTYGK